MNDDQILLANAYFDGELDAAERARAEADPVVLAEVERLSALVASLRQPPPPSDAARQSAIAAALSEFDRNRPASPTVVPITRTGRHRSSTWLAVAAGVLGIGLFGVVVAQNGIGGNDDDDAGFDAAAQIDTDQAADQPPAESAKIDDAVAESATASATAEAAGAATASPMLESTPAEVADAAEESASAEASGELSMATTAARVPWAFDPSVAIPDTLALADVGAELLQQQQAETLVNTPETRCGTDYDPPLAVLAEGLYQVDQNTVVTVYIAVDQATAATTYAIDRDTCQALASTAAP